MKSVTFTDDAGKNIKDSKGEDVFKTSDQAEGGGSRAHPSAFRPQQ